MHRNGDRIVLFCSLGNKESQNKSYSARKKTPGYTKHSHKSSGNVIDHIQESYDFVWNAPFVLEDNEDSIIYGELIVSPPPSG